MVLLNGTLGVLCVFVLLTMALDLKKNTRSISDKTNNGRVSPCCLIYSFIIHQCLFYDVQMNFLIGSLLVVYLRCRFDQQTKNPFLKELIQQIIVIVSERIKAGIKSPFQSNIYLNLIQRHIRQQNFYLTLSQKSEVEHNEQ